MEELLLQAHRGVQEQDEGGRKGGGGDVGVGRARCVLEGDGGGALGNGW